jgi:hypothetical protein
MTPPPPEAPVWSVRVQGERVKSPGVRWEKGVPAGRSASSRSKA